MTENGSVRKVTLVRLTGLTRTKILSLYSSRHPCIPPTTPVLYHELSQSNIIQSTKAKLAAYV